MQLVHESGGLRQFENTPTVRREPVRDPDPLHGRDTEPDGLRHGRAVQSAASCGGGACGGRALSVNRPRPCLSKPLLSAPDGCLRLPRRGHDSVRAKSPVGKHDDMRPPDMLLGRVPIRDECSSLRRSQAETLMNIPVRCAGSHKCNQTRIFKSDSFVWVNPLAYETNGRRLSCQWQSRHSTSSFANQPGKLT